jgi:hypothetical protein
MTGSASATDAGAPAPGAPRVIEERPPPGLARGKFAWPGWAIGTLGGIVVALGLVWIFLRLKRRARR